MERQIKIIVTDTAQLTERVIDFYKQFDFKLTDNKDGILKFKQNSSLLDAWKTNPLKWGAEIIVSIVDNKVLANFCVDTDAQMKTKEEEAVWQTFIDNFENYLTNGKTSNEKLTSTISDNKKSRLTYLSWTILGALTGGLLGFLYNKLVGNNSTLSIFLIPVFAILFLGWRINYVKRKNAI
jgi:hypothetical protein